MIRAIIGAGEIGGRWPLWLPQDSDTLFYDINPGKATEAAKLNNAHVASLEECLQADEIVLALPAFATHQFLTEYGSQLQGKIVLETTSTKNGIVGELGDASKRGISVHTMCGGATTSLRNHNVCLMRTRDPAEIIDDRGTTYGAFFDGIQQEFRKLGANVVVFDSGNQHDLYMGWDIALYHHINLVNADTMRNTNVDFVRFKRSNSVVSMLNGVSVESVVHSNKGMYADIQMLNSYLPPILDLLVNSALQVQNISGAKNLEELSVMVSKCRTYFAGAHEMGGYKTFSQQQFLATAEAALAYERNNTKTSDNAIDGKAFAAAFGSDDNLQTWKLGLDMITLLSLANTFRQSGIPISKHYQVEGTTAALNRISAEAIVFSRPEYLLEVLSSPYGQKAIQSFVDSALKLRNSVVAYNRPSFIGTMADAQEYILAGQNLDDRLLIAKPQFASAAGKAKAYQRQVMS